MQYEAPSIARVGSAIEQILQDNGIKTATPSDGQTASFFCNLEEADD